MPGESIAARATNLRATSVSNRRADIQGLRAIAVVVVVAFHAGLPVPGGFIGVDVFFVISGFVITGMLHREWSSTGRLRFGQFYLRRFKRLTPALALMVAVVIIASGLLLSPLGPQQNAAKTGLGAMLLVANFVIARTTGGYFDAPAETNPLLNTWSLSVEEQFYLLFPALIALAWYTARRRGLRRFSPLAVIGGIATVSFALAVIGSHGVMFRGSETILGFYSPFTRVWEFAAGSLLALALIHRTPRSPLLMAASGWLGLTLLVIGLWMITEATPFPGPWTLLPVVATLLLLLAGTDPSTSTSRLLSTRTGVTLGDWSYSIYLWHWPVIVFATLVWPDEPRVLVLAALASLAPALASYYWVEQPIRKLQDLTGWRWTGLIVTTIVVPVGLALALWFCVSQGWWSVHIRQFQAAVLPSHIGALTKCNTREPLDTESLARCQWNPAAGGPNVYLLGDSNADHLSEGFIGAVTAIDRSLVSVTTDACPFIDVDFRDLRGKYSDHACRSYVAGTLATLQSAPPGIVAISNSDDYWMSPDFAIGQESGATTSDTSSKVRLFEQGLARTVASLRRYGHEVLLVQTVPQWRHDASSLWDPSRCFPITILNGACSAERSLNRAMAEDAAIRDAVARVASQEGATVWDPSADMCPEGLCSTQGPGYIRYRDASHISVPQANELAPSIRAILENLG